jgi:molybdopterin converting factor subunit 1
VRVTVQVFARLRELAGRQSWTCDLPAGSTVADLWRDVATSHPSLAEFADSVTCAVNADFAPRTAELREGDDIAFLPPVSGGSA